MFWNWPKRLSHAFRGLAIAFRRDGSFAEHLLMAAVVVVLGAILRVSLVEWCLLALCIGGVIGAEFFNTALEALAPAIDREQNVHLGAALDLAAAGVLTVATSAAVVGASIFVFRLGVLLAWWPAG